MQIAKQSKSVLIIGGAKGLGRYIAELFINKGFRVIVASLTTKNLLNSEYLQKLDSYHQIDLKDWGDTSKKVNEIIKEYGSIDILICNAAVSVFCRQAESI